MKNIHYNLHYEKVTAFPSPKKTTSLNPTKTVFVAVSFPLYFVCSLLEQQLDFKKNKLKKKVHKL